MTACPTQSLDALVSGELDTETAAELQAHVRRCAGCAREVDRTRVLNEALRRRAKETEVPLLAIRGRVEEVVARKRRARQRFRQDGPVLAALVCAAMLLTVGISQHARQTSASSLSAGTAFVEDPYGEDAILDQYGVWKREIQVAACELPMSMPPPDDGRNVCL